MSDLDQEKAFAGWLARMHLKFDPRLKQAVYLPANAPADEVRMLEINTELYVTPGNPITAVEMTPAVNSLPFRVSVADVTPDEWQQVQQDPTLLPTGWTLADNIIFRRAG